MWNPLKWLGDVVGIVVDHVVKFVVDHFRPHSPTIGPSPTTTAPTPTITNSPTRATRPAPTIGPPPATRATLTQTITNSATRATRPPTPPERFPTPRTPWPFYHAVSTGNTLHGRISYNGQAGMNTEFSLPEPATTPDGYSSCELKPYVQVPYWDIFKVGLAFQGGEFRLNDQRDCASLDLYAKNDGSIVMVLNFSGQLMIKGTLHGVDRAKVRHVVSNRGMIEHEFRHFLGKTDTFGVPMPRAERDLDNAILAIQGVGLRRTPILPANFVAT